MADRRQVASVGRREADPARDGLAGRPVHDLDLDRDARRRQHLDRARPGGIAARAAGQQLGRRHVPVVEADDGVLADRQVDHAGPCRVARAGAPRPAPADDPAIAARAVGRLVRRHRPDDRPEVHLGRAPAEALDPDGHARAAGQRVGGAPVDRHGGQDDVAPRPAIGQRLETEGDGLRFGLEADRVEPQERIAAGARHEVGHPDLVAAVRAGHDRERPGLAGRGVAARPLVGVRSAPVQDLVLEMRDRGERAGAPAEDALVDLEPAPDEPARRPAGPVDDRVAGERLADRHDVPDGETRGALSGVIPPGVAEMGDDDVAGRAVARQVDLDRRAEQHPARFPGRRSEVERQAVEDRPTGRQPLEGGRVPGLEAAGHPSLRGIPAVGRCRRSGRAGWNASSGCPATRRRDNVLTGHRPDASIVQTVAQEAVDARSNPRRPSVMTRPAVRANGSSPARVRPSRRSGSRPEARSTTVPSAPSPVPCGSDVA